MSGGSQMPEPLLDELPVPNPELDDAPVAPPAPVPELDELPSVVESGAQPTSARARARASGRTAFDTLRVYRAPPVRRTYPRAAWKSGVD